MNIIELSVVIPVYNAERYLHNCLDSIVRQIQSDKVEVIIVDDGSSDASGKICDQYALIYNFIKVIHKKNEGCYQSRILGSRLARGTYLWFVDSDDWIAESSIGTILELIDKKNSPDVLLFGYMINGITQSKFGSVFDCDVYTKKNDTALYEALYKSHELNPVWCKCWKRELFLNNKYIKDIRDFMYGEDIYITAAIFQKAETIAMNKCCLYSYRICETSATHRFHPFRIKNEEIALQLQYKIAEKRVNDGIKLSEMLDSKAQREAIYNVISILKCEYPFKKKIKVLDEYIYSDFWNRYFEMQLFPENKNYKFIYNVLKMNPKKRNRFFKIYSYISVKRTFLKTIRKVKN